MKTHKSAGTRAPVTVNPVFLHPHENRQNLDGAWTFRLDPDDAGLEHRWFDNGPFSDLIQVPGTWQGQGFGNDDTETLWDFQLKARIYRATYTGTAWYAKSFQLPGGWQGKRVWVNFGGVHPSAEVWLNGIKLGDNQAPFVPFGFEITDVIGADAENLVVIRVHEKNRALGLAYNWQGNWSGLFRSVELTASGPAAIERFWVHADVDNAVLRIRTAIDVPETSVFNATLEVTAYPCGAEAASAGIEVEVVPGENMLDLAIPSPRLWSPDAPNLYRVDAALLIDGEIVDCRSERIGFLKLSTRGKHFCINDEPYYMRGSCDHHSSPLTGCPDWDRDRWRKNLATLREYGYNWTRLVYAYTPEYYDAADEVGLLVQSDMGMLGAWGGQSVWHDYPWPQPMPNVREDLKWQWDRTVMRDVNHPSASLYCMSNELWKDTLFPRTAWQCYHDTKTIKPTALVIWTDGGFNADMPADYVNHHCDFDAKTPKPVIVHEYRWWSSFPDVRLMDRFSGALRPYAQQIALEAATRKGIAHVLPQAAVNSQRLQYVEMKGKLEMMRRDNPTVAGIEHTNGTDIIPSPQGVVDVFYEKKHVDAPRWLQTMGDAVVLSSLDFDQHVLSAGDRLSVDLFVSDFAHPPFESPDLEWRLTVDGDEIAAGEVEYSHEPYRTCAAGRLEADVPALSAPRAAELQVRLRENERVVANCWGLWLLPKPVKLSESVAVYGTPKYTWLKGLSAQPTSGLPELEAAPVLLAERIDEALVAYMRTGGRVILAASEGLVRPYKPSDGDAYYFTPPANYPTYEDGQNGTIIDDHPLLGDFFHEGFADLQFFRMIRNTPPLDLEAPGLNHGDPVIRVLHRYQVSRPLAYMIECTLGRGTLIISALNLDQTLPEARYLLAQMCRHAATGIPRPMMELTEPVIERLISATALP